MDVLSLDNLTPAAAPAVLNRPSGEGFAQRLQALQASASQSAIDGVDADREKDLRKAAEQLVATTFIQPMLAKMREDPFKSDLFHGGRTEEIFGEQLDTILSERIVSRADFSIVDAVYNRIAKVGNLPLAATPGVDTHG
jgi:Rod binding domain-containing protein